MRTLGFIMLSGMSFYFGMRVRDALICMPANAFGDALLWIIVTLLFGLGFLCILFGINSLLGGLK